ncbi:MAG: type V CRISPR-associated protein Cas12a/Cpf1 [Pseudomonadales bacterium]|nr:type V CRISPR-associated protein Cas12a/Cpf1 [Pseudomonadales bacterium]
MKQKKPTSKNTFADFTNLYSLSKTLRFELVPYNDETRTMLGEHDISQKGKLRKEKYEQTKPFIDRLHREFVQEALLDVKLEELAEYAQSYEFWKKDKKGSKQKKALESAEKALLKEIGVLFDSQGKKWAEEFAGIEEVSLKKKDKAILFEEGIMSVLKYKYGEDPESFVPGEDGEQVSIFDDWKGFSGYFTKFFETRKNFYTTDGKATEVATRIVNNLRLFLDNRETAKNVLGKLSQKDIDTVGNNFDLDVTNIFTIDYYNRLLLQDGIDHYNIILGGETKDNGEKLQGLNELINLWKQQNPGEKPPFFKKLQKQILSPKEAFIEQIESDEELRQELQGLLTAYEKHILPGRDLFQNLKNDTQDYDLDSIYFNSFGLNTLIQKWVGDKSEFINNLYDVLSQKEIKQIYEGFGFGIAKRTGENTKFPDFVRLSDLQAALLRTPTDHKLWKESYYSDKVVLADDKKNTTWQQFSTIFIHEFEQQFQRKIRGEDNQSITAGLDTSYKELVEILPSMQAPTRENKVVIKNFADDLLRTYQMAKYFALEKKRSWVSGLSEDPAFYADKNFGYYTHFYENAYEDIVQPYNRIRNYLTKKNYGEDKWKLNFNKSNLLGGWPDSPPGNTQYGGLLFRKDEKYFLGVTDYPKVFDKTQNPEAFKTSGETFEKMVYKQIDAKTLYGSVYKGLYGSKYSDDKEEMSDNELIARVKEVLLTKVDSFPKLHQIIKKIEAGAYTDAKELAREISAGNFYNIDFIQVSADYLKQGRYVSGKNQKNLFLFQIKNKDWNKGAKKTQASKNLHTLYFEALFSEENKQANFPFKLNGQAELFFRPKVSKSILGTKKDKQGKEVIDHKRFNKDMYYFHVPLTVNRTQEDTNAYRFNREINEFLADKPNINIIGLDRGEKHLIYYSVIDQKGERIDAGSFNTINGKNYKELLEQKAEERKKAKQDWQSVEQIKDLKKGYLSLVVRKVVDLVIAHNAIIVMEDLNMRFKQIRGGIEQSVYQQFEKALIDKLSFLVNKGEKDPESAGYLLRAYQLAAPFESFQKMGKQTGIIFYTTASYTSKIDPLTGWRPNIYLKYSNQEKAKKDIAKFKNIVFDSVKNRFEFTYDLADFYNKKGKIEFPQKREWTVCSNVERYAWDKRLSGNKGGYTHYPDLTDGKAENMFKENAISNFKNLFESVGIDIRGDIQAQIAQLDTKDNKQFFSTFMYLFRLILQIRNTNSNETTGSDDNDYLQSPVEPFFDTRRSADFAEGLPQNGDENGAYNIARKGIFILDRLSEFENLTDNEKKKLKYPDILVRNVEWDAFATESKMFLSSIR